MLWAEVTGEELWVTSLNDHIHTSPQSLHYASRAIDLDTPQDITGLADWLTLVLRPPYQVINEINHVHVEWDD